MTIAVPPATVRRLDANQKQEVKYCIPTWLRDEQIKHSIATVPGRIQPHYDRRPESIAVVGFGPSLQETWEGVHQFPYVISCSGAHKFLIERGIVPTYHAEVDPRAHKVGLLGPPHPNVEYLISSTCHPDYFTHLSGFNVKLWHVFDASDNGIRLLPPGEWAITGGCDVGLRAMTLAAFLGFRDLHIFGLDGCAKDGTRHAAEHPYGKQKYAETVYEGKTYLTTPAMLEAARQTVYELKQMPTVRATFYGEGLTQAMAKDYQPDGAELYKPMANVVGYHKPELISAEYRSLNAQLHRENMAYGVGGENHTEAILKLCGALKTKDVLDYGCGKGRLAASLPFHIQEYDPAIPGKETSPKPADIVVCTDVLEHIEPEKLIDVLLDLKRCVRQVGYFTIHMGPASKTLPDGRNTHLIQRPRAWWEKRLRKIFRVGKIFEEGPILRVVLGPIPKKQQAVA